MTAMTDSQSPVDLCFEVFLSLIYRTRVKFIIDENLDLKSYDALQVFSISTIIFIVVLSIIGKPFVD